MAKHKTEQQIDRDNRFGKPLEWAAAAAVGVGSGYTTLLTLVSDKFHDYMLEIIGIKEKYLDSQKARSLSEISADRAAASGWHAGMSEAETLKNRTTPSFIADTKAFIKNIHDEKTGLREFEKEYAQNALGIESYGLAGKLKGLAKKFQLLSTETRWNLGFKTVFAIGAGAGVTLMAFNQLNTRDKLNEIDKNADDTHSKLDRLLSERSAETTHTHGHKS